MRRSLTIIAATAAAVLSACGGGEPEEREAAADTGAAPDAAATEAVDVAQPRDETASPGPHPFTEAQARGAAEAAGYTNVGPLTLDEEGVWRGKAVRGDEETMIHVDRSGAVVPD